MTVDELQKIGSAWRTAWLHQMRSDEAMATAVWHERRNEPHKAEQARALSYAEASRADDAETTARRLTS